MQLFGGKQHLNTWLEEAKQGKYHGQKAIFDLLSPKMYAVCVRYMGDREIAQDVLQDGFVTLFTKLESYSGEGSFEGWARKIFVNTALMALRKRDVLKESEDIETAAGVAGSPTQVMDEIGYKELTALISELPPGFRTVFNMYVIEGYSHKEIAESLGISEATSRSQLLRARALLQSRIEKKEY
ncbi:MAG: sigma-70 family RNA polymerase sigma factor [Bacteroidales bacterium]|nr:sigma-70 family RNA polymerase sigma factor [Bacteroidales bacterium]